MKRHGSVFLTANCANHANDAKGHGAVFRVLGDDKIWSAVTRAALCAGCGTAFARYLTTASLLKNAEEPYSLTAIYLTACFRGITPSLNLVLHVLKHFDTFVPSTA
jgi:hypothetical protein